MRKLLLLSAVAAVAIAGFVMPSQAMAKETSVRPMDGKTVTEGRRGSRYHRGGRGRGGRGGVWIGGGYWGGGPRHYRPRHYGPSYYYGTQYYYAPPPVVYTAPPAVVYTTPAPVYGGTVVCP